MEDNNILERDAYEWWKDLMKEFDKIGFTEIHRIPQTIKKLQKENKKLNGLVKELKDKLLNARVDEFNKGYESAKKDYVLDEQGGKDES